MGRLNFGGEAQESLIEAGTLPKNSMGGREVNMINTVSKINLSKIW